MIGMCKPEKEPKITKVSFSLPEMDGNRPVDMPWCESCGCNPCDCGALLPENVSRQQKKGGK